MSDSHLDQLAHTLEDILGIVNGTINTLRKAGCDVQLFVVPAEETWVPTFGARVRTPDTPELASGEWWCGIEVPLLADDREILRNAYRQAAQEIDADNDEENEHSD